MTIFFSGKEKDVRKGRRGRQSWYDGSGVSGSGIMQHVSPTCFAVMSRPHFYDRSSNPGFIDLLPNLLKLSFDRVVVPSTFKLVHVVLLKRHKFYPLGKKKKKWKGQPFRFDKCLLVLGLVFFFSIGIFFSFFLSTSLRFFVLSTPHRGQRVSFWFREVRGPQRFR